MKKIHTECLGEWFHIFIPFWRSFMLPSHSPNDGPFGLPSVSQERDWRANTSCRDFRMDNHLLVGCNGFMTWKLNPCSGYLAIWKKVRCILIFAPTIMGVKPCCNDCNGKDDLWGTHFHDQKLAVGKHSMEGEATSWNAIFSKKKLALLRLQRQPYKIFALALPCDIRPCSNIFAPR